MVEVACLGAAAWGLLGLALLLQGGVQMRLQDSRCCLLLLGAARILQGGTCLVLLTAVLAVKLRIVVVGLSLLLTWLAATVLTLLLTWEGAAVLSQFHLRAWPALRPLRGAWLAAQIGHHRQRCRCCCLDGWWDQRCWLHGGSWLLAVAPCCCCCCCLQGHVPPVAGAGAHVAADCGVDAAAAGVVAEAYGAAVPLHPHDLLSVRCCADELLLRPQSQEGARVVYRWAVHLQAGAHDLLQLRMRGAVADSVAQAESLEVSPCHQHASASGVPQSQEGAASPARADVKANVFA